MTSIFRSPKFYVILTIASAAVFLMLYYPLSKNLPILLNWISAQGSTGIFLYIAAFTLGTAMFFPGSIFVMGAGFTWGMVTGSITASVSLTLSAAIAFLIGRYIARGWVAEKIKYRPGFKRIDAKVSEQGFKIVFLMRLSPIFPFTLHNYGYGSTGVKFVSYIFATWLGMMPGTIMYVYFGTLIDEITKIATGQTPAAAGKSLYMGLGLFFAVAVMIYIVRIARDELLEKNR